MTRTYSLEELAESVQSWCNENAVLPANGQAAEQITERTIRYYRTLGLLDTVDGGYVKRFKEKHRLQLIAIRFYQAHGFPLRRIREELYGQTEPNLAQLVRTATRKGLVPPEQLPSAPMSESWAMTVLTGEFLLISRRGRVVSQDVIARLREIVNTYETPTRVNPTQN